jgi:arsenite/tail-anchored protein-transporting ATPase
LRIIFFAGKGGVGKTSVAAATGVRSAEMGKRTLVMSLDVAHSLADIFDLDQELLDRNQGRPFKITDNLWIQEMDIQEEIGRNWRQIHGYLSGLLNTSGLDEVLAEELAILPGMEEISLLLYINQYVRQRRFDVILLDCAPTGESLRFISIPTTLEWYMKKVFKLERALVKVARPLAKRLYDVPLPDDGYFKAIEDLCERLRGVDQVLCDPTVTTVRLVANPEKIVLKETQRAFMYFCLYKMCIDAVIMNRVLPPQVKDAYFKGWLKGQNRHIENAKAYFRTVPILPVNLFGSEIVGYEDLKNLAGLIYGQTDPLERFVTEEPYRLTKENGHYRLKLKLPFVVKEDIDLSKISDELILRIGSYKRHILLPKQVAMLNSVKAKIEEPYLNVFFGGEAHEQKQKL